jgi:rod shape-determining protein MreC
MVSLFLCSGLIMVSLTGLSAPVETIAATPLNFIAGLFNRIGLSVSNGLSDLAEIQTLRERNAELEETLAQFQAELVELREVTNDYQRLTDLLDYTSSREDQTFVTADVIALDQSGFLGNMIINRGSRDGITKGMPVVTREGLVGRVNAVSANATQVQLITDPDSAISARLQTTRVEGSVVGVFPGGLSMTLIPLGQTIQEGDLVITSGLGGNLPPDLTIGQVASIRQVEAELYQEAEVRSLVDFDTLEFVLVVTSFQPVDLSVFEEEES